MRMSELGQGLTFTKNVGRGFLFYFTPPAQWTVYQLAGKGVFSGCVFP